MPLAIATEHAVRLVPAPVPLGLQDLHATIVLQTITTFQFASFALSTLLAMVMALVIHTVSVFAPVLMLAVTFVLSGRLYGFVLCGH